VTVEAATAEAERRQRLARALVSGRPDPWLRRLALFAAVALLVFAAMRFDLIGAKFAAGLPKLADAASMMVPPRGWQHLPEWLNALAETIAMAFMGTLLGAIAAVPLGFACARNTLPLRALQFGFRRFADSLRSLDHLIWAIVFVRAVGLGPLAGIMAIAVVDAGTLAKLYSEAIENVDRRPLEGARSTGASEPETIRWGLLPQVLPNMLASTLYMWESNTRSATILGIVGAGGIGYQLSDRLRVYDWGEASTIILLILIAVYAIDLISARLRRVLIQGGESAARLA